MKYSVMYFYAGQWQPLSPGSALYKSFCTEAEALLMMQKVKAIIPFEVNFVNTTAIQQVLFDVNPPDYQFFEAQGTDDKTGAVVQENLGLLQARFKDRKLQSGGNIDHATGDDLVIRSNINGLITLGWGA